MKDNIYNHPTTKKVITPYLYLLGGVFLGMLSFTLFFEFSFFGSFNIYERPCLLIYDFKAYFVPLVYLISFVMFLNGVISLFRKSGKVDDNKMKGKRLIFYSLFLILLNLSIWFLLQISAYNFCIIID